MYDNKRFAIVITHMGGRKEFVEMPWLQTEYHIEESDWMVLSHDGWRGVAEGETTIWEALERKLLIGFYLSQPQLIVVIGHPSEAAADDEVKQRQAEVRRIVQRVRSLLLPTGIMGIWTDESGALQDILEPSECAESERAELQLLH